MAVSVSEWIIGFAVPTFTLLPSSADRNSAGFAWARSHRHDESQVYGKSSIPRLSALFHVICVQAWVSKRLQPRQTMGQRRDKALETDWRLSSSCSMSAASMAEHAGMMRSVREHDIRGTL